MPYTVSKPQPVDQTQSIAYFVMKVLLDPRIYLFTYLPTYLFIYFILLLTIS